MATVNIHAAKTQFSRLIEAAEAGEETIIARAGRPVARLVPFIPEAPKRRVLGMLAGRLQVPADFDRSLPTEIQDTFEAG